MRAIPCHSSTTLLAVTKELAQTMKGLTLSARDHPGVLLEVKYDDKGDLDRVSFIARVSGRRHEFIVVLPTLAGNF